MDFPCRLTRCISSEWLRRFFLSIAALAEFNRICCCSEKNELPAKTFQAVVRGYGQLITTAGAAALQNIASISSGHAFAEAVNTDTTSDFRLISAFGSHFSIFSFQFPDRLQSGLFTENCLLGFRLPPLPVFRNASQKPFEKPFSRCINQVDFR